MKQFLIYNFIPYLALATIINIISKVIINNKKQVNIENNKNTLKLLSLSLISIIFDLLFIIIAYYNEVDITKMCLIEASVFIVYLISIFYFIYFTYTVISNLNDNNFTLILHIKKMHIITIFIIAINMIYMPIINYVTNPAVSKTMTAMKPIIYLYPEEETSLNIKLGKSYEITSVYPNYIQKDGWNILAEPSGNLIDLNSGRTLYSLYYENDSDVNFKIEKEGFIVKGEDVSQFLEEKLSILGLNERESEEFIIYWLPKLEKNKYNYIRFASIDEINQNMPLELSKEPDSIIRVLMTYKSLNKPIEVNEQVLQSPIREGFTLVEWGGLEIK